MCATMTYRKSGVDVEKANRFVDSIRSVASKTHGPEVLKGIGGFGALFKIPNKKIKNGVFVSSADGVGTKLKCCIHAKKFEMLGEDLVAMNVNDIVTSGAEPLFFLDYISIGKLQPDMMRDVIKGIAKACRNSGCALIGGETAEMPGLYSGTDFDLAGFAVGVADEKKLVTGAYVRPGDSIIGMASNGFHSNGFSLVRKVFNNKFLMEHADEILRPTRLYVKPVLKLMKQERVLAMAHITGGGFYDNIPRVFPNGLGAVIHAGSWKVPRIFKRLQKKGSIPFKEMYRTFNMGVGFIAIVRPKRALKAMNVLRKNGVESWIIGEVVKGEGVTIR